MGIENLQLWRTEPFQSTFQEFFPDKPGLEHKYPLQGRWFSSEPYYHWLGPDTVMKELETKFPFQYYDKAGQIEIPGEGFTMKSAKTAAELAKDQKVISEWLPTEYSYKPKITESFKTPKAQKDWNKYIDAFWKRYKTTSERGPLDEGVGRYTDNPVKTYPRWLAAQKKLAELRIPMTEFEATGLPRVLTPPLDIANQAKVNLWESFKQNFMKYDPGGKTWVREKGIHYPKSRLENILRIPHKAADIFQRYRAGQPIKSGIPWSTIGRGILNNPATRFIGGLGNVALGGQALLDIGTGSQHTKNMMTDINRMTGVPVDRQGNAITNIRDYRNLQKVAQRDVLNPNEMRGVTSFDTTRYNPREMNTGGIASLVV